MVKIIKPDNQQRVVLEFNPAPYLVNGMIENLNAMTTRLSPQEYAAWIGSQLAAIAFVLHSSNTTEQVVELFSSLVKDAGRQFEHRKKLLEKEAANPLKHKP
jgi:hypothetical protein